MIVTLFFVATSKVLDFGVVKKQHPLVVNVIEVFPDTWFWTLALSVEKSGYRVVAGKHRLLQF